MALAGLGAPVPIDFYSLLVWDCMGLGRTNDIQGRCVRLIERFSHLAASHGRPSEVRIRNHAWKPITGIV